MLPSTFIEFSFFDPPFTTNLELGKGDFSLPRKLRILNFSVEKVQETLTQMYRVHRKSKIHNNNEYMCPTYRLGTWSQTEKCALVGLTKIDE